MKQTQQKRADMESEDDRSAGSVSRIDRDSGGATGGAERTHAACMPALLHDGKAGGLDSVLALDRG